jgi:hypothetical protein
MPRRSFRTRSNGVVELPRRPRPLDELLRTALLAAGGIVVVITVSAAVAWSAGEASLQRTAVSVCWNWAAGVPTGCWTR